MDVTYLISFWRDCQDLLVHEIAIGIENIICLNRKAMDDPTRSMNALKRQQEEKRRKHVKKDFRDGMISKAVSWLFDSREKNGGKLLPYGKMSEVIKDLSDNGVTVSRNVLNHFLKKYVKRLK